MPTSKSPTMPVLAVVTPAIAAEWLELNTHNRALSEGQVSMLTREITEGRWLMTGDPVRFDVNNVLIDGQHRLHAIVRAKKSVPMMVMRGLPTEVRDVLDTNLTRSAAHVFTLAGIKNSTSVAAATRIALGRRDGMYRSARDARTLKYSNSAVLEFYRENPDIADSVAKSHNASRALRIKSGSAWDYCMWELGKIDENARAEFVDSLVNSRTTGKGDGRQALIQFYANDRVTAQTRYIAPETIYTVFRSWNAWRTEEVLTRLTPYSGVSGPQGAMIPQPV